MSKDEIKLARKEMLKIINVEKNLWSRAENGKGYYFSVECFGSAVQTFNENPLKNLCKVLGIKPNVIKDG